MIESSPTGRPVRILGAPSVRRRKVTVGKLLGGGRGVVLGLRRGVTAPLGTRVDSWIRISRRSKRGRLELGKRVWLFPRVAFYLEAPDAVVCIGADTFLNRRTEVMCQTRVSIGKRCAIAWDVLITDTDYHAIGEGPISLPVNIGDDVWIGAGAKILKGVTIGCGAVVAAGSIVSRDIPSHCLVAGIPARVVRQDIRWQR